MRFPTWPPCSDVPTPVAASLSFDSLLEAHLQDLRVRRFSHTVHEHAASCCRASSLICGSRACVMCGR